MNVRNRDLNCLINRLQEEALKLACSDHTSMLEELLKKDKTLKICQLKIDILKWNILWSHIIFTFY